MKLFKYVSKFFLPFLIAVFNLFILLFPNEILSSSKNGIVLWSTNILPTLLPFTIGTNILIQTGIIELTGIFLEPVMYPLFKVPGCSAFALICGMISGYPIGAKITQVLRSNEQISKSQAQRLISFCNNSGPLFIIGAIGTSMLGSKKAGYFIMFVHYFSAIITGLVFRFFFGNEKNHLQPNGRIFFRAAKALKFSHTNKSIGKIISDSVHDSIETVLQIGGFIVLFSVAAKILELSNIIPIIWYFASQFDFFARLGYENFNGIIIGIIEMTNGAKILTMHEFSPSMLIILSALVSFGGFSIHMQSLSFITKTDISPYMYIFSKTIHALISVFTAKIILPLCNFNLHDVRGNIQEFNFTSNMILSLKNLILALSLQIILIFIIAAAKKFRSKY